MSRALLAVLLLAGLVGAMWVLAQESSGDADPGLLNESLDKRAALSDTTRDPRLPQRSSTPELIPVVDDPSAPVIRAAAPIPWMSLGEALTVTGKVTDAEGVPLAEADVWFLPRGSVLERAGLVTPMSASSETGGDASLAMVEGAPLSEVPHTRTNAQGEFSISGPEDPEEWSRGPYRVPKFPQLVVVKAHFAARVESLRNGLTSDALVLLPEGGLIGRVLNEAGEPIAGATVRVAGSEPSGRDSSRRDVMLWPSLAVEDFHSTRTGPDGAFRLGRLWPNQISVEVLAKGYARAEVENIDLVEGGEVDAGDLVLVRGSALWGRVLSNSGAPLADASVFATAREVMGTSGGCSIIRFGPGDDSLLYELEAEHWRPTLRGLTDEQGRFALDGLLSPNVTLYAYASGYEATRLRDVEAGRTGIELRLDPEAALVVRIVSKSSGAPIPEASLTARRVVGDHHSPTQLPIRRSGDDHIVHGVGHKGTTLTVRAPGYAEAKATAAGQAVGARELQVVELLPQALIAGRVVDEAGAPIEGAAVSLIDFDYYWVSHSSRATTGVDGRFSIEGIGSGVWNVAASAAGRARARVGPISTSGGDHHEGITLTLSRAASLEGIVHETAAKLGKVPEHSVTLEPSDVSALQDESYTTSGEDGRFRFDGLAAAEYRLVVGDVGEMIVTLGPGEHRVVRFDRSPPQLEVQVLMAGPATTGLGLEVRQLAEESYFDSQSLETDPGGHAALLLPGPGEYEVLVTALREDGGFGPIGMADPITLAWGDQRKVRIDVGTGRLAGRVVGPQGPVAEERLSIQRNDDWFGSVTTDDDGRFSLEHLLTGVYAIRSNTYCSIHPRHPPALSGDLQLASGQTIDDIVIPICRGASVSGCVRTAAGALAQDTAIVFIESAEGETETVRLVGGQYSTSGLAAGTYRICSHRGWYPTPHDCETVGLRFTVRDGDTQILNLVLRD
ncbi:MAG: carboxypeptidase regulatory-like domain-containing protein [Planctomycetota bacterium]